MKVQVSNTPHECTICLDPYGNLYFVMDHLTFQVNIDGKNKPYSDPGDYTIIEDSHGLTPMLNFNVLDGENSLRAQVLKSNEIVPDDDNIDEHDKYYPEDVGCINSDDNALDSDDYIIDEDSQNKYGHQNHKFNIYKSGPDAGVDVQMRMNGDIMALYDTYLYDLNNNLVLKTNSKDNSSIYRFRIFANGDIWFRPIGETETKYVLRYGIDDNGINRLDMIEQ